MKRVLIPIDATRPELVRSAIEQVTRMQREQPVHVELVSVQPRVSGHVAMFFKPDELRQLQIESGHEDLQPAQKLLDAAGIAHSDTVRIGRSADTIVALARELGCSEIVFGNGSGGLDGQLFGTLAQQVRKQLAGGLADLQVIGT